MSSLNSVHIENSLIGEAATNLLHWILRYGGSHYQQPLLHIIIIIIIKTIIIIFITIIIMVPGAPLPWSCWTCPPAPSTRSPPSAQPASPPSTSAPTGFQSSTQVIMMRMVMNEDLSKYKMIYGICPKIYEYNLRSSFFPSLSCRVGLVKQCPGNIQCKHLIILTITNEVITIMINEVIIMMMMTLIMMVMTFIMMVMTS